MNRLSHECHFSENVALEVLRRTNFPIHSFIHKVATGHTAPAYSGGMGTIEERSRDYTTVLMDQIETTKTKNGNPVQFGLQPNIEVMQANIAWAYTIVQATAKARTIHSILLPLANTNKYIITPEARIGVLFTASMGK